MTKHDVMKTQTCVLKVNINCSCEGCVQKVRKVLQKMEEVYSVSIDADHGKVTVTGGNLDPSRLIQKLSKSGKHAELWGVQKSTNINMQNQFKNTLMPQPNKKGGGRDSGGGGNFKRQMKVVSKNNNKSVKFNATDDDDDGCLDVSDDDDDDDEEFSHGHGHSKKMVPTMMGKNGMMMNGKNGGKKGKKNKDGDIEILPISLKKSGSCKKGEKCHHDGKDHKNGILGFFGFGKNSYKKYKDGDKKGKNGGKNNSKKANGDQEDGAQFTSGSGAYHDMDVINHGKTKNNGGRMNVNGGCQMKSYKKDKDGDKKGKNGGKSNSKKANGDQEDGAQFTNRSNKSKNGGGGAYHDMDVINHGKTKNNGGGMNVNGGGQMGMAQMGNYPRGQMGSLPRAQGMGPGYYQGMGPGYYQGMGPGNNVYNQQQYMAMMNQQQRMMMNGNDMYQQQYPMMYARPQAPMGYGPPPVMPPPPQADPITHMFSDENTESCSIM